MNFDEAMGRFFKSYSSSDRSKVEEDISYQKAKSSGDYRLATEIACGLLEGMAKSPAQGRKIRKDKQQLIKDVQELDKFFET